MSDTGILTHHDKTIYKYNIEDKWWASYVINISNEAVVQEDHDEVLEEVHDTVDVVDVVQDLHNEESDEVLDDRDMINKLRKYLTMTK